MHCTAVALVPGFPRLPASPQPRLTADAATRAEDEQGRWRIFFNAAHDGSARSRTVWGATFEQTPPYYKSRMESLHSSMQNHAKAAGLHHPPRRVLTVFGPEGSGTKLLADLLATAAGIFDRTASSRFERHAVWRNNELEVQHVSLPFGYPCEMAPPVVWPVFNSSLLSFKPEWHELLPTRCFVNISNHVRVLRADGFDVTAVVIMRDLGIAQRSNAMRHHCRNESLARAERSLIARLIGEALSGSERGHVELVSYESLMALGFPYVARLCERLGLPSIASRPGMDLRGATADSPLGDLHDSNAAYLRSLADMIAEQQERERLRQEEVARERQRAIANGEVDEDDGN